MPGGDGGNTGLLFAISASEEEAITDRAYPLMAAKWPFGVVFVCWEDFDQTMPAYRTLIRNAVSETWERHSGIEFPGWGECQPADMGVRIAVIDDGPHVKFLGKFLNGVKNVWC